MYKRQHQLGLAVAGIHRKLCHAGVLYLAAGHTQSMQPVSYTHLDVYKRQLLHRLVQMGLGRVAVLVPYRSRDWGSIFLSLRH